MELLRRIRHRRCQKKMPPEGMLKVALAGSSRSGWVGQKEGEVQRHAGVFKRLHNKWGRVKPWKCALKPGCSGSVGNCICALCMAVCGKAEL